MLRIPVQSRYGNFALVVLGILYAIGALTVLTLFIIDVRDAAARLDRLMQLGLVVAAAYGVWLTINALHNLGVHVTPARRDRRAAAARS
ncbi:MAG TPA: hypothetical protein VJZ00_10175 [Thermoanaerobaculia bacterium]|nr:hypothetical protein [Thermoanaerobaculia bacterium]